MKADNNDLEKYEKLVQSIRIDHPDYEQALEKLEEAYKSVGQEPNPICIHIAGQSRTGKSSAIKDFMDRHPSARDPEGLRQSIVYARLPANASVKALVERLLHAFGDPAWYRGSTSKQTARLLEFLRKTRCRMIILDEFQHLCDKGQQKQLHLTSDWLKDLVEDQEWALVAAGLPESASVINSNVQLASRFDPTLTMPLFNWLDSSSRTQFRAIIRAFVAEMKPFELPDLGGEELGLRTFLATSGRVGLFAKLMGRAVRNAISKKTTKIRLEDLSYAFQSAIWFAPRFPLPGGPFLGAMAGEQTEIVEKVVTLASNQAAYDQINGVVHLQGVETSGLAQQKNETARPRPVRRGRPKKKEELRGVF